MPQLFVAGAQSAPGPDLDQSYLRAHSNTLRLPCMHIISPCRVKWKRYNDHGDFLAQAQTVNDIPNAHLDTTGQFAILVSLRFGKLVGLLLMVLSVEFDDSGRCMGIVPVVVSCKHSDVSVPL